MKYSRLQLESFETASERAEHIVKTLAELEEDRLTAFEKGYSAGWEDSSATREAEEARLRAAVGQSLQEMSFTYHEARHHLLESLRPLIVAMVEKILPSAARASLPQLIAEQIRETAQTLTDLPITVSANPACMTAIHTMLEDRAGLPVTLLADPALSEGQAYIKFPETETRIDLDDVISRIASAVDTYFSANPQEATHG
ncbi:hypothetical protein [Paenirhodobacter sp.]|uniref:FliH/SctL family protein n=1 Tax=Paenirhodobacter sp. TaxID=1965326 RepID=UPI003B3E705D